MRNFPRLLYYLVCAMKRLHWNRDKLRKYQEKRLQSVVKYAYDFVPFYHRRFKEAGVTTSSVKTPEDLARLPIFGKDELKREKYELISNEFDIKRLREVKTSGSTGHPIEVYLSRKEDEWRKAIYMRANISCGQKARDRWVVITNPRHFMETTSLQRKLGVYAQTCVSVLDEIDKQIKLVSEAKPDVLDGYSGSILLVAREIDRRGGKTIQPRIVFGNAELMDAASIHLIERVLEAPYYDQFGCVEVDRTAWVCPEKVGYHLDIDSVLTEFVDDEGTQVSAGERGEIVYTSLFNYAMPLIRYAVGDVGIPSDEKCPCGRTLPLMKIVEGRKDSLLLLPDGRLLSPLAVRVAMSEFYEKIMQYRVVQKKLDLFEIYIKKKDGSVDEKVMEAELVPRIKKMLHIDPCEITFEVRFVEDIPLSRTGKLMAIVSELKPNSYN